MNSLLFIVFNVIIIALVTIAAPFYSLTQQYHFDGTPSSFIQLTDLVCVKGNNPRSIKFQMKSTNSGYPVVIGTIFNASFPC